MAYFKTDTDIKNKNETKTVIVRFRNQEDLDDFIQKTGIKVFENNSVFKYNSNNLDSLFDL